MTPWWINRPDYDPPGPEICFRFTLPQAHDVLEAYKASRFARPFTREVVAIMRTAIEAAALPKSDINKGDQT